MEIESPEIIERPHRPILELMRHRAETDWGVHPNYTKEYRELRWTGKPWRISSMTEHVNRFPQEIPNFEDPPPREIFGPGIRVAEKPNWMVDANYRTLYKRNGNWNRNQGPGSVGRPDSWKYLSIDLAHCMRLNIPFKTNTIEYKPSSQWVHIKGVPVVKYNLETGKLEGFTYSGVYDKVITFVLRNLFQMNIVLEKRKLIWRNNKMGNGRPGTFDLGEDIIIDLNTFYYFRTSRHPDRYTVSIDLVRENARVVSGHPAEEPIRGRPRPFTGHPTQAALDALHRRRENATRVHPPLTTLLRNRDTTI